MNTSKFFITKLAYAKEPELAKEKQSICTGFFEEGNFSNEPTIGSRFTFYGPYAKGGGIITTLIEAVYKVGGDPDKLVLPDKFPPTEDLVFPSWPGQPGELKEGDILFATKNSIYWLGSLEAQGRS